MSKVFEKGIFQASNLLFFTVITFHLSVFFIFMFFYTHFMTSSLSSIEHFPWTFMFKQRHLWFGLETQNFHASFFGFFQNFWWLYKLASLQCVHCAAQGIYIYWAEFLFVRCSHLLVAVLQFSRCTMKESFALYYFTSIKSKSDFQLSETSCKMSGILHLQIHPSKFLEVRGKIF